jgi:type I restriction enzyme S subunit
MLYKETDFKETPIGKIPKDWEVVKLGEACKMKRGFSYRSRDLSKDTTRFRFLTINDFEKEGGLKLSAEPIYLKEDVEVSEEFFVRQNDIFIANTDMSKGFIIGAPLWIGDLTTSFVYSMDLTKLILDGNKISSGFLFYLLSYEKIRQLMKSFAQGTNVLHLNHDLVKLMQIILPPLLEQYKIAEILSTVDEAIRKTDEVIAKTERLKKGLMQELLTRGIGHKEFKDTEIGRIPKEWEVVKLGNKELATIIMGQSPPSSTYNREGKGLPFLQGKMEFGDVHPSPVSYCSQPIKIAEPNDILISVRAPVGDVNVAPHKLCIGRGLAAIRFNLNRASYWFYFYYFQKIKNFLENLGKGSTFKAITKEDLENLKVPYPSFFEQQRIAKILFTIDKKLEVEKNEKQKLERIKQGLMDLLLTGKIRVKVEGNG